ncbi:hypothetical protein DXG01_009698 [Tephrocybe rancida]|nr:hypothetical protein DXG01_011511 [Tephrocybe rancida]KAG6904466.1 hypothetical protein DXG01_009698 [Tephrocybe rancida]
MPATRRAHTSADDEAPGLRVGARKKIIRTDPLTHTGQHFRQTVYAFSDLRYLLSQGLMRTAEIEAARDAGEDDPSNTWSAKGRQEFAVYNDLLLMHEGLEKRLTECKMAEEIELVADLIHKGASSARAEDTKSLKPAIIDLITPPGGSISPPLHRRQKIGQGYNHYVTGEFLCPAGLNWANDK